METSGRRKAGDRGSVKTTKKESKKGKGRGEKGRTRRIAFCLCSIKGEITHLLRFFLKTTALIDQTAWMYQPIFNMKYRHQKSITPVFSLPSVICSSLLTKVDASTSLSALLSVSLLLPHGSPSISLWHVHYVIHSYTSAWQMGKSIIFNNYLTFSLCCISAASCSEATLGQLKGRLLQLQRLNRVTFVSMIIVRDILASDRSALSVFLWKLWYNYKDYKKVFEGALFGEFL